jgi:DMSO reductase anchor subunit
LLAFAAIALLYTMAEVYHVEAIPAWNNGRTRTSFTLSAVVLGMLCVLAFGNGLPGALDQARAPTWWSWVLVCVAIPIVAALMLDRRRFYQRRHTKLL